MAKEICISTTPHETRLAILEDDQLAEIYYERENEYTLAGSIYKGRVTRVLPGMQSSFVDVGLERDAFLYVTDFLEEQEDSEEYGGEPSGPRQAATRSPEETQGGTERPDRAERSERGERNGRSERADRGDRSGSRRPAPQTAAAPAQVTSESAREGGRAARERAREQVIAPLREAVPAAQDLQEKGDEESPSGTRRWRGRRGRRRGVRGGLADPRPLPNSTPEALEEAGTAEYEAAAPFAIAEHGAPGGVADLHASPESLVQREAEQPRDAEPIPRRESSREGARETGRDRGGRRQREPYAQASTIDRRPASEDAQSGREPEIRASAAASSGPVAIVLPGESLSKYGSASADPALTAAPTATVPRPAGRPVNYIAPKPSTLVELSGSWDGGAVLPGETLSRYRGTSAGQPAPSVHQHDPLPEPLPIADTSAPEVPADAGLDQISASAQHEQFPQKPAAPEADSSSPEAFEGATDHPSAAAPAHEVPRELHSEMHREEQPAPLAEPEMMAEALPSTPEPSAHVPEASIAHPGTAGEPVGNLPEDSTAFGSEAERAEYEPQNASASYRVDPAAPRGLRIAGLDEQEDQGEHGSASAALLPAEHTPGAPAEASGSPVPLAGATESSAALAEPAGQFADAHGEPHTHPEEVTVLEPVAQLSGELEPSTPSNPHGQDDESTAATPYVEQPTSLRLLHGDGSVETLGVQDHTPAVQLAEHADLLVTGSVSEDQAAAVPLETQGLDLPVASLTEGTPNTPATEAYPAAPGDFAEMVDRLQGFAPGHGLLEEETIDEEEYDFEPLHAHSDEHDQEDLEEETLDHQLDAATLSDAVRDSYLEQRVHQLPESQAAGLQQEEPDELEAAHAEAEASFGYIEISEEEEEEEGDEPEEGAAEESTGDSQRPSRSSEDRGGRGRGGRSAGGRNGSGGGRRGGPGRGGRSAQSQDLPIISDMLKQGQEILVQIAKEPIAKKGARITSHIALPGRFLVFMPTVSHVGVSRKIASDEERQRLKRILISEKGDSSGGFIVRTAAEGAGEEDLRADLRFLISLWTEIKQRSDSAKAPALIYHDLNLIERILRDQVSSNFSTIWVDSEAEYERIIRFLNRFQPALVRRVKLYTKETPLFEHFGIQEEISKALKSKVWLKSGGSIVINQTEALVAIDINTGKYVGKTARLEDTIVKTNLDAIPEIVRQIRLRDLGGIIVIDFIDMDERKNRNRVLAALEEELKHDRAPSKVLQFNDFGLVAITRKRVKQSLERTLSVTCEVCTGTGMVKSPITVCNEIYIEMRKMQKHLDGKDVMLRVHPEVVKQLKAGNGKWINELEEMVTKTIIIKSDPALHPEQFDIH